MKRDNTLDTLGIQRNKTNFICFFFTFLMWLLEIFKLYVYSHYISTGQAGLYLDFKLVNALS